MQWESFSNRVLPKNEGTKKVAPRRKEKKEKKTQLTGVSWQPVSESDSRLDVERDRFFFQL